MSASSRARSRMPPTPWRSSQAPSPPGSARDSSRSPPSAAASSSPARSYSDPIHPPRSLTTEGGYSFNNFEFVSPRRCTGRVGLGTAFKDARQGYPFGGSAGLDKRLSLLCGATIKRKARCAYAYTGILGKSGLGGQPKHLRSIFSHTQMAFSFFVYGFFWLFCTFLPFWVIHNCQNGKLCMSFHFLKQRKKEFSPYKKG